VILAHTPAEFAAAVRAELGPDARPALVPTMGALHRGHRELMKQAKRSGRPVAVSIFVNPLQFGRDEDLDRYPRSLESDLALCEVEGVSAVYNPDVATMYPSGTPRVTVQPGPLGTVLEGRSRPGHFAGVLTVVAKLFNAVRPGAAYFGEKDYQQLALIRAMVRDLDFGIEMVPCPTVREQDGLALSSRNRYLSTVDRKRALELSRALFAGAAAAYQGAEAVFAAAREQLSEVDVDYLELTDPDLGPAPERGAGRLLVAARVGSTRLIDNVPIALGEE
jgi:pantoate--beta-alanine ligase